MFFWLPLLAAIALTGPALSADCSPPAGYTAHPIGHVVAMDDEGHSVIVAAKPDGCGWAATFSPSDLAGLNPATIRFVPLPAEVTQ